MTLMNMTAASIIRMDNNNAMIGFDLKAQATKLVDRNAKLNEIGVRLRINGDRFRPCWRSRPS